MFRGLLVTGTLALLAAVFLGQFHFQSICPICGNVQSTTKWQIPFTEITYWTSNSFHSTALASALVLTNNVKPHQHEWHFATGAGNGVMCALGDGRHFLNASQSTEWPFYLQAICTFESAKERDFVLSKVHDLIDADKLAQFIASFPAKAATDRAAYLKWKEQNAGMWNLMWTPFDNRSSVAPLQ